MKHELWYSVVVRDRHGKVVSRERRRSRSFLNQWNKVVYVQMHGGPLLITMTSGGNASISPDTSVFRMDAGLGVTTHGIRVGTGNTAVAIDDYALETPIEEGTGAGQMEHLACTITTFVVAAPSCSHVVSRTIANNSGGEITVREAVIYMRMGVTFCCGTRDVFTTPQAVPNGGSITIDWTIGVTV